MNNVHNKKITCFNTMGVFVFSQVLGVPD